MGGWRVSSSESLTRSCFLTWGSDDAYDDEWLGSWFNQILWGYPDLVQEFYDEVHPVLAPLREQNMRSHANATALGEDNLPMEVSEDDDSALQNYCTHTSSLSLSTRPRSSDSGAAFSPSLRTDNTPSDSDVDFPSSLYGRAWPSGTHHLTEDLLETSENDGQASYTISHHAQASSPTRSIPTNSSPVDDVGENLSAQMSSGEEPGYEISVDGDMSTGSLWNGLTSY